LAKSDVRSGRAGFWHPCGVRWFKGAEYPVVFAALDRPATVRNPGRDRGAEAFSERGQSGVVLRLPPQSLGHGVTWTSAGGGGGT